MALGCVVAKPVKFPASKSTSAISAFTRHMPQLLGEKQREDSFLTVSQNQRGEGFVWQRFTSTDVGTQTTVSI